MNDESLEARITDLEMRYTVQEDVLQQLSDLVRTQQDTLDSLLRTVDQLRGQLREQLTPALPPNERPPHY